jgi:hypothetical protein
MESTFNRGVYSICTIIILYYGAIIDAGVLTFCLYFIHFLKFRYFLEKENIRKY